jgi:hypothetical protein
VSATKNKPLCARHDPGKRNRKTKEWRVIEELRLKIVHEVEMQVNKIEFIECSSVKTRKLYFPDVRWDLGAYIQHGEIDEDQHKNYECEAERIMNIAQSRFEAGTFLWRFNPDAMHLDGTTWRWSWIRRLGLLTRVVRWGFTETCATAVREAWDQGKVLIFYLFYDDRVCIDNDVTLPIQARYLSVKIGTEMKYVEEVVELESIGFI